MWIDELVGMLGDYAFTLKRGKDWKNWTLIYRGKTFKAKDGLELMKKVETWRNKHDG
jgi:hypothetical protein